jgi:hypothetical protein
VAVAAAARCGRLAGPFHASRTQLLRSASAPFLAAHPSGSSKFLTPRPRRSGALCSSSPLSPPRLLAPAIPPPPGPFCYSSRAPPWCCTPPGARPPRATHSRLRLVPRPGDLHGTSASPPLYDATLACSAPSLESAGWHPCPPIPTHSPPRLTITTSTTTTTTTTTPATTTPAALASTYWHRLRRPLVQLSPHVVPSKRFLA